MTTQHPSAIFAARARDEIKYLDLHGWTQLVGRIDLSAFQRMDECERRAAWATASESDKLGLILQILRAKDESFDSDVILGWQQAMEARLGGDLAIPPTDDILATVKDRQEIALAHGDYPGARQLDRVRVNIKNGARLHWSLGDLLIQSVNTPGAVYSVNARGCSCPNGAAGKQECWHVALYDVLVGLFAERADQADEQAEYLRANTPAPVYDVIIVERGTAATLGARLAAARAALLAA